MDAHPIGNSGSEAAGPRLEDDWKVSLRIHDIDAARGLLEGVMEARNVRGSRSEVITLWEAEVIDNTNHTFWTDRCGGVGAVT